MSSLRFRDPISAESLVIPLKQGGKARDFSPLLLEVVGTLAGQDALGNAAIHSLSEKIKDGKKFSIAFAAIPSREQKFLKEKIGERNLDELLAMSHESDPRVFFHNLQSFALSRKNDSDYERAAAVLGWLAQTEVEGIPKPIRERAELEFNAIVGKGAIGRRIPVLFDQGMREALNPKVIGPMVLASVIGHGVGAFSLARLLGSSSEAWYAGGMGARVVSGFTGYSAEVSSFALVNHALHATPGASLQDDFWRAAIAIGALKSSAFLGNQAFLKFHGLNEFGLPARMPAWLRFNQVAVPQLSMFNGMLLAHGIETKLGLRPHSDDATLVTDTLSSMFSLGLGMALAHRVLGPGFAGMNLELKIRAEDSGNIPGPEAIRETFKKFIEQNFSPQTLMAAGEGPGGILMPMSMIPAGGSGGGDTGSERVYGVKFTSRDASDSSGKLRVIEIGEGPVEEIARDLKEHFSAQDPNWMENLGSSILGDAEVIFPEDFPGRIRRWGHGYRQRIRDRMQEKISALHEINEKLSRGEKLSTEDQQVLDTVETANKEWRNELASVLDLWTHLAARTQPAKNSEKIKRLLGVVVHDTRSQSVNFLLSLDGMLRSFKRGKAVSPVHMDFFTRGAPTFLQEAISEGMTLGIQSAVDLEQHVHLPVMPELDSLALVGKEADWRLVDVLTNLVSNAVRYNDPQRPGKTEILRKVLSDGSVEITVADIGIGIEAKNLARLGQEGFQEKRKPVEGSSGLGISSVIHTLKEQDWGPLWVKSVPKQGTHFRFVIPAEHLTDMGKTARLAPTAASSGTLGNYRAEGFVALSTSRSPSLEKAIRNLELMKSEDQEVRRAAQDRLEEDRMDLLEETGDDNLLLLADEMAKFLDSPEARIRSTGLLLLEETIQDFDKPSDRSRFAFLIIDALNDADPKVRKVAQGVAQGLFFELNSKETFLVLEKLLGLSMDPNPKVRHGLWTAVSGFFKNIKEADRAKAAVQIADGVHDAMPWAQESSLELLWIAVRFLDSKEGRQAVDARLRDSLGRNEDFAPHIRQEIENLSFLLNLPETPITEEIFPRLGTLTLRFAEDGEGISTIPPALERILENYPPFEQLSSGDYPRYPAREPFFISLQTFLSGHGVAAEAERYGRSEVYRSPDQNRLLAIKFARDEAEVPALVRELDWMNRLGAAPQLQGLLLSLRQGKLPQSLLPDEAPTIWDFRDSERQVSKDAIVFRAPLDYYRYLDDPMLSDAEFMNGLTSGIHDIFALARFGIFHTTPITLFHNRLEAEHRSDLGRYLVAPDVTMPNNPVPGMGRLENWPEAIRHGNIGVSGIRDLEELADIHDLMANDRVPALSPLKNKKNSQVWYEAFLLGDASLAATLFVGNRIAEAAKGYDDALPYWRNDAWLQKYADQLLEVFATGYAARRELDVPEAKLILGSRVDWLRLSRQLAFFMTPAHVEYLKPGAKVEDFPQEIYGAELVVKGYPKTPGAFGPYRENTFHPQVGFIAPGQDPAKLSLGAFNNQNPIREFEKAWAALLLESPKKP